MTGTNDCGGDAAAYVLGALEPDEAEAFRHHMEDCVVCRDEVESLQHVATALPMAAAQYEMPRGVRRRVLAEVRADAKRRGAHRGVDRGPHRGVDHGVENRARLRRPVLARPALAAGLAAVIALAAIGGVEIANSGGPSTRVISASLGAAQVRISDGRAELVVNHLPAPAAGHIYEVWLKRGSGKPLPTKALFSVTSSGAGDVDVPGSIRGVNTIMVTQEPAGGSQSPTGNAVIVAHL